MPRMLRLAAQCPECGKIATRMPEGAYAMSVEQWRAMQNDLDEIELMCEQGHKFKRLYKNLTVLLEAE
jgi:hypothetical protein